MFDEVDEGTAIFKCANNVPVGEKSKFITYDGLPSDHYLKMVGASAKLIRGESLTEAMPGSLSFSSQSKWCRNVEYSLKQGAVVSALLWKYPKWNNPARNELLNPMLGDSFNPAAHMHFLADIFGVRANGFGGDVQLVADLFVNKSFGKQIEHFALPPRQGFRLADGR